MTLRESAELLGLPIRRLPLRAYRASRGRCGGAGSEAPPGQIEFEL